MRTKFLASLVLSLFCLKAVAGMSLFSGPSSGTTKPLPATIFNPPIPLISAVGYDTNTIQITVGPGTLTPTNSAQKAYFIRWNTVNDFASSVPLTTISNSTTTLQTFNHIGLPPGITNYYWAAADN